MPGTNQFQALALGGGANVLTPAAYAALTSLIANGYQSGTASSQQVNTTLRQATFVANAIAQIIANNGVNALDDGNSATFVTNLLAAIAAQGVTATQFDNTTKNATTAFVQKALGSFAGRYQSTGTETLTAAHAGKVINMAGVNGVITLPLSTSVPPGTTITLESANTGQSVARQGGDIIFGSLSGNTSVVLLSSDSLVLESNGFTGWTVIGGTAAMRGSPGFQTNFGGYAWLPTGMILQWMNGNAGGGGAYNDNTFPIAFPHTFLVCTAYHAGSDASVNIIQDATQPNTATTLRLRSTYSTAVATPIFALGF
jgi:hypothetical protein